MGHRSKTHSHKRIVPQVNTPTLEELQKKEVNLKVILDTGVSTSHGDRICKRLAKLRRRISSLSAPPPKEEKIKEKKLTQEEKVQKKKDYNKERKERFHKSASKRP
jgi:hypothetical protein